jgi:hypothetical protein
MQGGFVFGQGREALVRRGVPFVGDIVGAAGKGVDGFDRRRQAARHQDGGDREVLVMVDGHANQ